MELGEPSNFAIVLYPAYLRGEAFLQQHNGVAAAAEYRESTDRPGLVANFPLGARWPDWDVPAYALQGDEAKARAACEEFLKLWKDSDAGNPILKQAKAECAGL